MLHKGLEFISSLLIVFLFSGGANYGDTSILWLLYVFENVFRTTHHAKSCPHQQPSGTFKAYLPELQPSKCPDHSLCHKQSAEATMYLIKKTRFTREYIPPAFRIHFNEMHLISALQEEWWNFKWQHNYGVLFLLTENQ